MKNKYNIDYAKDYGINKSTSSATDCTGLIPATPETHEELDSFEDIHDIEANGPVDKR